MKPKIRFYKSSEDESATVTIGKVKFYLKYIKYGKKTIAFDMNCPVLDQDQYMGCYIYVNANKIQEFCMKNSKDSLEIPYTKSISNKTYREIIRKVFNSYTFINNYMNVLLKKIFGIDNKLLKLQNQIDELKDKQSKLMDSQIRL